MCLKMEGKILGGTLRSRGGGRVTGEDVVEHLREEGEVFFF